MSRHDSSEGVSGIDVSVRQLPPTPYTSLRMKSVNVGKPESLPVSSFHPRGDTVSVEEEYTVPDGSGGEQTAYYGVVNHKGEIAMEFELRAGSNLLVVWNFKHLSGYRNILRVKYGLDCISHYSQGGTREEVWDFINQYGHGDVRVRTINGDRQTLSEAELQQVEQVNYIADECRLRFDGIAGEVIWYTHSAFEFTSDRISQLEDAYPVVEAFEENMPERRRKCE